ncbi:hypothetical protein [Streptomyces sp. RLB3-6]|uniref:hypothetical protein n=1 Tax=Streptomyces sp. RLB3-6 TaxID=2594457 RepID=UPI001F079BEA|nr:hypothetical protein [Streptomyces sp. RLB3-6]
MTTSAPRSPRMLLIATVLLAVCGLGLLAVPQAREPSGSAKAPGSPALVPRSPAASPAKGSVANGVPAPAHAASNPTRGAAVSALPPHGEGVAGDRVIQEALDAAWPADLPPGDARRLLAMGRSLLRADATGAGRGRWPTVFTAEGRALAPAFARFRIQAAIARRDSGGGRAVVHLVWAGADRGGTYTDGRVTDWRFTRTTRKGLPTWIPLPRT